MKYAVLVSAVLIAGVLGGAVGTYVILAQERRHPKELVRAQRFELVNDNEQTISVWGVNEIGYVELSFGPTMNIRSQFNSNSIVDLNSLKLKDGYSYLTPRAAIGLQGEKGGPFLRFEGANRELLVLLDLDDFERPSLQMSDGHNMGLTLGSERSDTPDIRDKDEHWALNFLPEESARIGVHAEPRGGTTKFHGFVWIRPKPVTLTGAIK